MEITKLKKILNEIAPEHLQESWDNSGMQIDMGRPVVNKVLVCLEITKAVVEEAIDNDVDMIITHHPLLFSGIKRIDNHEVLGNYIIDLIFTGISVYSSHTAFDTAQGGNNDDLAELMGLTSIEGLPVSSNEPLKCMGRMGLLPEPVTLSQAAGLLAKVLKYPGGIKVAGDPEQMIHKVGLCTGAAGDFFHQALAWGCDLYISGDVRHHDAQLAKESGICLIDAGHFGTENIFTKNMASQLKAKAGDELNVIESTVDVNPFDFVI